MMKAGCLCALVLLSLPHCQAVGYGSHLLSLITGKHSNLPNTEALDLPLDDIDHEEEVEEESLNVLMEIHEKKDEECVKFQLLGFFHVFLNCNGIQATL